MKFVLLSMLSIVLLGTGNVAHHLFDAFIKLDDVLVKQVYGRSPKKLSFFADRCDTIFNPDSIADADIFIIAVSDDAIAEVSSLVTTKKGLVVHTSGSISKNTITAKRKGVFYPLQTFTNGNLIKETADKLRFLTPEKAQTGPAKRNDVLTMQKHLDALKSPLNKKIYQLISESIKSVCIISGGNNEGVRNRFKALGVTDIYLGAHHKQEPLDEYLDIHNIKPENALYMGDDVPDIPPMKMVQLATCPQNAVAEVKSVCDYISHKNGGDGKYIQKNLLAKKLPVIWLN